MNKKTGPAIGSKHHGYSQSPTYKSWRGILQRCENQNCKDWSYYGARGIQVCDRWKDFRFFLEDMGERPEGTSIDRLDSDGNYEPGNCVWSDIKTQNRNRKGTIKIIVQGVPLPLPLACEQLGIKRGAVAKYKFYYGTDYQTAFDAVVSRNFGQPS